MNILNIDAIPDMTQTGGATLPEDGDEYCAPVAVSNSLMWLAANGYPDLAPNTDENAKDQIELVRLLGSPEYMNTAASSGTSWQGVVRGIRKRAGESGYKVETLEYKGLELALKKEDTQHPTPPPMDLIRQAVSEPGAAVWALIGWYKHDAHTDTYRKLGGHWMTVAGYGAEKKNDQWVENPNILIVHDPSPRAGNDFANEFILLKTIASGALAGMGLPQSAAGYKELVRGIHLRPNADCAILEGIVVLKLAAGQSRD